MSLHTLLHPVQFALEVKKSRFLARASSIDSTEAALAFLRDVADPAATHNCWAYRLGEAYRFSDDGEPGGSAGRPILAAIDGQGCDQVMMVVTRWYGGVNLGVGGLVRAYGGAAAECLRSAAKRELVSLIEVELRCAFALSGSVHGLLAAHSAEKLAESFDEHGLRLRLRLPVAMYSGLGERLRDLSRGAATLETPENHCP